MTQTSCPLCGAPGVAGVAGCQQLYTAQTLRLGLPAYAGPGRAAFDAYCLQHPELYCVSAKSCVAHLTMLCCWAGRGAERPLLDHIRRALDGRPALVKPDLPAPLERGRLTVTHLTAARGPHEAATCMTEWAASVWAACAPLHSTAHTLLGALLRVP